MTELSGGRGTVHDGEEEACSWAGEEGGGEVLRERAAAEMTGRYVDRTLNMAPPITN